MKCRFLATFAAQRDNDCVVSPRFIAGKYLQFGSNLNRGRPNLSLLSLSPLAIPVVEEKGERLTKRRTYLPVDLSGMEGGGERGKSCEEGKEGGRERSEAVTAGTVIT